MIKAIALDFGQAAALGRANISLEPWMFASAYQ